MIKNIFIGLVAFAACVGFNCALIWSGYFGFAVSLMIALIAVLGILAQDNAKENMLGRVILAIAVAFLYLYTVWFPEVWITILATVAIVGILWLAKDYSATEYVSLLTAYFLAVDIAFYLMGDPVLEWVDAVLFAAVLACSGLWIYHTKTLKP